MIKTEYQAVIGCDSCGEFWTEAYTPQLIAVKNARKAGWRIGKKGHAICPRCICIKKREDMQNG